MSQITHLASGQLNRFGDTLTVELVQPDSMPAAVRVVWHHLQSGPWHASSSLLEHTMCAWPNLGNVAFGCTIGMIGKNPETHEHYEVCLRCNAYRERARAYPGAGAAGGMSGGFG